MCVERGRLSRGCLYVCLFWTGNGSIKEALGGSGAADVTELEEASKFIVRDVLPECKNPKSLLDTLINVSFTIGISKPLFSISSKQMRQENTATFNLRVSSASAVEENKPRLGHGKSNPGHGKSNPGHGKSNPGHGKSNPGHGKSNPGHGKSNPGHGKSNPGHGKSNPGHGKCHKKSVFFTTGYFSGRVFCFGGGKSFANNVTEHL
uniref:Uncharacterized protein n=1 Tax=Oncorhynchus mykiss TaxID=8022 RepID=A0A8K9XF89_ONCMY